MKQQRIIKIKINTRNETKMIKMKINIRNETTKNYKDEY